MLVVALAFAVSLRMSDLPVQSDPAPRDGEIRVAYSDLLRQTEIALTLQLKSTTLTIGRTYSGKTPLGPAALFDVRATNPSIGTPRLELSLAADGETIDLVGGNPQALRQAGEGDYVAAIIPAETMKRVAAAGRITGNALGVPFELTASQRDALRTFVARAMSADPANAK